MTTARDDAPEAQQTAPAVGIRLDRQVRPVFRGLDCACPTDSALHCAWLRYGDHSDRCQCPCHEQDNYDD